MPLPFKVGCKVQLYFSWFNPNRARPIRTVKKMFEYTELKETTNSDLCSYISFEDSDSVASRHEYQVVG